jgi:uncharacterized membrane protein
MTASRPEGAPQARVLQSPDPIAPGVSRIDAVDILRGLVMVIMALDHTRDYFTHLRFPPEDMSQTYLALWLTRWITHFCAPAFFFLAGTGAYLSYARHGSLARTSRFLWTRGLWLVLLEATVIGFGWTFIFPFPWGGVIWALGWCMVINAAIVRLPMKWIAGLGALMVLGHNLLDKIQPVGFGTVPWYWVLFHEPGLIPLPRPPGAPTPPGAPFGLFILYPLVPWIGVMALGFAFGQILRRSPAERQRWMLRAGALFAVAFIVLRATNVYGNPRVSFLLGSNSDFHWQGTLARSFILFTNVEKYPPSLQFLLMTLGPSLIAMALFDKLRLQGRGLAAAAARFFVVFGRVPMFYYILHIYLIHLMALGVSAAWGQPNSHLWRGGFFAGGPPPAGFGFNLPFIYLMWALAVLILYFPCRWFMGVKQRKRSWWLSYI